MPIIMEENIVAYIERLEMMAFFTGYPLIYSIVKAFSVKQKRITQVSSIHKTGKLLPYAYALAGTLYLGLVIKNLYPEYSLKNITDQFQYSYLKVWGLTSLLFWIPFLSRKTYMSLLHSLVFFFFLIKDIFIHITSGSETEIIKNDMKIYTDSLIINTATLIAIIIFNYLLHKISSRKNSSPGGYVH